MKKIIKFYEKRLIFLDRPNSNYESFYEQKFGKQAEVKRLEELKKLDDFTKKQEVKLATLKNNIEDSKSKIESIDYDEMSKQKFEEYDMTLNDNGIKINGTNLDLRYTPDTKSIKSLYDFDSGDIIIKFTHHDNNPDQTIRINKYYVKVNGKELNLEGGKTLANLRGFAIAGIKTNTGRELYMSEEHVKVLNIARSKGYSIEYGHSRSNDIIVRKNGETVEKVFTFMNDNWRDELINKIKNIDKNKNREFLKKEFYQKINDLKTRCNIENFKIGSKSSPFAATFFQDGVFGQITKVLKNNDQDQMYQITYKGKDDSDYKTIESEDFTVFENIIKNKLDNNIEKPVMLKELLGDYSDIVSDSYNGRKLPENQILVDKKIRGLPPIFKFNNYDGVFQNIRNPKEFYRGRAFIDYLKDVRIYNKNQEE